MGYYVHQFKGAVAGGVVARNDNDTTFCDGVHMYATLYAQG